MLTDRQTDRQTDTHTHTHTHTHTQTNTHTHADEYSATINGNYKKKVITAFQKLDSEAVSIPVFVALDLNKLPKFGPEEMCDAAGRGIDKQSTIQ